MARNELLETLDLYRQQGTSQGAEGGACNYLLNV